MTDREIDRQLVARAQRGDKQAFELLVEKYQRKLARLLSRFIRDPAEVEDVTQEAFIKAYRALPSFRGLAEDLLVSVITVKRAYEELEREGIIYRRQGLGTFVADTAGERSRDAKKEHARRLLVQALREATEAGLGARDVVELLRTLIPRKGVRPYARRD